VKEEKFKLLENLGGGGFGWTYKVQVLDNNLREKWGDIVAIKVPHNKLKEKTLLKEAFKYEKLKDIGSRNIVQYLDFELYKGQYVLLLEYVEGQSLDKILKRRKRLAVDEALDIIEKCCEGLIAAHKVGIFHRDIDPSNILICKKDNTVKISDFGIAEILRSSKESHEITGKLDYMAPEVFEGKGSFSSDIWSLGVTLYQILTGRLPFSGRNQDELMDRICKEDPIPPIEIDENIDDKTNQIVLKALKKSPEDRYRTASEFLKAIKYYRNKKSANDLLDLSIAEAWDLFRDGRLRETEEKLKKILEEYPDNPKSYLSLGEFYNRSEQYDLAIKAFNEGIKVVPNHPLLYRDLAISLHQKGQIKEAIEALKKAISLGLEDTVKRQANNLLNLWEGKLGKTEKVKKIMTQQKVDVVLIVAADGPMKGHKFIVRKELITVGRAENNDVSLPLDLTVSRKHALISYENGKYWIEDTNSRNGTYMGEFRINKKSLLPNGTLFRVGQTILRFKRYGIFYNAYLKIVEKM
jgi:serine/threonine-protein kinase